jgi:hypothetical protein
MWQLVAATYSDTNACHLGSIDAAACRSRGKTTRKKKSPTCPVPARLAHRRGCTRLKMGHPKSQTGRLVKVYAYLVLHNYAPFIYLAYPNDRGQFLVIEETSYFLLGSDDHHDSHLV